MRRGKRTVRISEKAAEVIEDKAHSKVKRKAGKSTLRDPLALPKRRKSILVPTKAARKQPAEPEEYEVERIIDHKVTAGRTYYRIRWKGWSAKDDTWQMEGDLSCEAILKTYKNSLKELAISTTPTKKKKPAGKQALAKSPKKSPTKKKGVAGGKVTKGRGRPKKVLSSSTKRVLKTAGKKRGRKPKASTEWEVEEVVAVRKTKSGKEEFLIKWKGYASDENTWEPAKNVENCGDAIERFKLLDPAAQNGNADDTVTEPEDASAAEEPAEEDEVVVEPDDEDSREEPTTTE